MRSLWDLTNCHEDSQGISHCQERNEVRSLRDLMDCQEGSKKFPIFQVGMGTEMGLFESLMNSEVSLDQPEELTEQMSSEMDLDQHMQLTEEEYWRNLLMIGGIEIFLPLSPEEAKIYLADEAATARERQPAMTVKE
jgi:hypothetical protein